MARDIEVDIYTTISIGKIMALLTKKTIDLMGLYFSPTMLEGVNNHFPLVILLINRRAYRLINTCRVVRMAMVALRER